MSALTELVALWIGIRPGHFSVDQDGKMVINAMRRGQRIPLKNGGNVRQISYHHRVTGFGRIVCLFTPGETVPLNTTDLEPQRTVIKKELAHLGITGQVVICVEPITPLDGHDARF